ncbi:MAG: hypothetical protein U1E05_10225 [Patescibacteria group bacterium]|nr:hypothetical protein [Patescibacteria group bacterium]
MQCLLQDETLWLTQRAIAELFGVNAPAISKHLANIYETGELAKEATVSILETVQIEGGRRVTRKLEQYEEFRKRQDADYVSDFDREIKRLEGK